MNWNLSCSHTLEYVFLTLKILGVVGASYGFSLDNSSEKNVGSHRRKLAYTFLAIAISAELCDSFLKASDAREQAQRFERLAHPLGTIRVTPVYQISLDNQFTENYKSRIAASKAVVRPNLQTEEAAYTLLTEPPRINVFVYKKGVVVGSKIEPNISFEVVLPKPFPEIPNSIRREQPALSGSYYIYDVGKLKAQPEPITNTPENRYSDGEIISDRDLLGATIEVLFCPSINPNPKQFRPDEKASLQKLITPLVFYVELPGRQEFEVNPNDQSRVTVGPVDEDSCSRMLFKVPETTEDFKKILLP